MPFVPKTRIFLSSFSLFSHISHLRLLMAASLSPLSSSVKLLSLMFDMIQRSSSFLLQCVQADSMELLAYLLSRLSSHHLSLELVSCLFNFAKYLIAAPNGSQLFCHVVEHLLFNPGLWIKADKNVGLGEKKQILL